MRRNTDLGIITIGGDLMKHRYVILLLVIFLALAVSGCSGGNVTSEKTKPPVSSDVKEPTEPSVKQEPGSKEPTPPIVKDSQNNNQVTEPSIDKPTVTPVKENKSPDIPVEPALSQGPISLKIGDTLPEFILTDLQGKNTSASSIITQHKLTLINFWTTT